MNSVLAHQIETFTGREFDLLNVDESNIDILDIAHALSNTCRFAGHTQKFYSVAQHSVLVSELLPGHLQLVGLLHDASEAYIHDITTPLKSILGNYRDIEKDIWRGVAKKFDLLDYATLPLEVKIADYSVLGAERRDMMASEKLCSRPYYPFSEVISVGTIIPLIPEDAKMLFLQRFKDLQGSRKV